MPIKTSSNRFDQRRFGETVLRPFLVLSFLFTKVAALMAPILTRNGANQSTYISDVSFCFQKATTIESLNSIALKFLQHGSGFHSTPARFQRVGSGFFVFSESKVVGFAVFGFNFAINRFYLIAHSIKVLFFYYNFPVFLLLFQTRLRTSLIRMNLTKFGYKSATKV